MPPITKTQLESFRKIKKQFGVPRPKAAGEWSTFSNNQIWIGIVSQVVVVGRAEPAGRLWEREIQARIGWDHLVALPRSAVEKEIWNTLRTIGTRFCAGSLRRDRKTAAL